MLRTDLPFDAPGGASYMKFRPFLTRSSPINNLEVRKQHVALQNISVTMSHTGGSPQISPMTSNKNLKDDLICMFYDDTKKIGLLIQKAVL